MIYAHRLGIKWARTLHVYLTLFGFALLLFFSVTGFMLNHEDWFSPSDPTRHSREGKLPTALLGEEPDRLGIVEKLRKDFGAHGEVDSFDDEKESDSIRVKFKAPGYFAEATIKREDGETTVVHESHGVVGVVLDLHRGKTSGDAWSFVIDGVSILFVIVSITGLILWSSLRSRAQYGIAVLLLGLATGLAVYFGLVPR
jgi:uncharacterized protein